MSKSIDVNKAEMLLMLFSSEFYYIDGKKTRGWKFKTAGEGGDSFYIQCRNGTKNYIVPDSCESLLKRWNKVNPSLQFKEVEKYCIEDDEVWTFIIWKLKKIEL